MEIQIYQERYQDAVIRLVLYCQNDGTRPLVRVEDQPELCHITEQYHKKGGCFWVALEDEKLAGTIGLMNAGNGIGILKKFFVYEAFRGAPVHLGRQLYQTLIEFAKAHAFSEIILDTPKNTARAHKFYQKAGFRQIKKDALPVQYTFPYADSDFFYLCLSAEDEEIS